MVKYFSILGLVCTAALYFFGCKKYEDPAAVRDPRINNPYCNDPAAVNYNWGFPGTPDNSVCYYATDIFSGTYMLYDSFYKVVPAEDDLFLGADSFIVNITVANSSRVHMDLSWACPSTSIRISAWQGNVATIDTTVGDSLTLNPGQFFCRNLDTVTGTFTKDNVDPDLLHMRLQVVSDTGITTHRGRAIKQ